MRPIRAGDRGSAVEDIQRRLLLLGYDLGLSGVDGVFANMTRAAVEQFQTDRALDPDGLVGDTTWAALVDATFTLGDRALYLRLPHMHGRDVRALQEALGALGFPCAADGIFGPRTEGAVRDFQRNVALPADGIAGGDTVETLVNLRHLWEGKGQRAASGASGGPTRAAAVLSSVSIAIRPDDSPSQELAARIANLALALAEDAATMLLARGESPYPNTHALVRLVGAGTSLAVPGLPLVVFTGDTGASTLTARMAAAFEASDDQPRQVLVDVSAVLTGDEQAEQRAAVVLLDAVCSVLD